MPRSILIFLFGDVGDTLLAVPAVRAIRNRYPAARLVLLTKPVAGQIISDLGIADQIVEVDKHLFDDPRALLWPRTWPQLVRALSATRSAHADVVVVLHHLVTRWGALKFALLALVSGAKKRVGLDNGHGWFLTDAVRDEGFGLRHEVEYGLEVAALLDARGEPRLEMAVGAADRDAACRLLAQHGLGRRPFLAMHPGTGWYGPGRRWPAERFARAAQLIMERHPMDCAILGTAQDEEEAREVARLLGGRAALLVGKTSLGQLGAVLERAELLLANDGGVGHVAAAVGVPVVSVFGPSNDLAWRPLTARVVATSLPCRPCFYRDRERGLPNGCATRECLTLVTPEAVAEAASHVLEERAVAR
jgi:heptosyltransferase-2